MSLKEVTNTVNTGSGGDFMKDGIDKILAELSLIYNWINKAFNLQTGDSAPVSPVLGDLWVKTTGGVSPTLMRYNGSTWDQLGESGGFVTGITLDQGIKGYSRNMFLIAAGGTVSIVATAAAPATIEVNGKLLQNVATTNLALTGDGERKIYAQRVGSTSAFELAWVGTNPTTSQRHIGTVTIANSVISLVTSQEPGAPSVSVVPTGAIMPYATNVDSNVNPFPTGWLICDGTEYSRTEYAALFARIGTIYGSTSGTTFAVPDLRTRVPVGWKTGDVMFGEFGAQIGSRATHTGESVICEPGTGPNYVIDIYHGTSKHNVQPSIVMNYIIKT